MSLDKDRLKLSIKDKIISKLGLSQFSDTELEKFCDAIAEAVVEEVTGNASVSVSVSGVTTGGSTVSGSGGVS